MPPEYTLQDVRRAAALTDFDSQTAQNKMTPIPRVTIRPPEKAGRPRLGAVLVLLYCVDSDLRLVLTRRRADLNSHAGQISFPGGKREDREALLTTALRETEEEIGVAADYLEVLGRLPSLYIPPSDFEVHPFVAWQNNGRRPNFKPSPDEVAEIIEVSLNDLLDPANRRAELWQIRGQEILVPYFMVEEHKVWGATAMMISELEERLRFNREDETN